MPSSSTPDSFLKTPAGHKYGGSDSMHAHPATSSSFPFAVSCHLGVESSVPHLTALPPAPYHKSRSQAPDLYPRNLPPPRPSRLPAGPSGTSSVLGLSKAHFPALAEGLQIPRYSLCFTLANLVLGLPEPPTYNLIPTPSPNSASFQLLDRMFPQLLLKSGN